MAGIVRKSRISKRRDSFPCSWCGDTMTIEEEGAFCEACDSQHHTDCWEKHDGCGNKGCVNEPPPPVTEELPSREPRPSPFHRLLSPIFLSPLAGFLGGLSSWLILEPYLEDTAGKPGIPFFLVFPMTGILIVLFIFIAEAVIYRKLLINLKRWLVNLVSTVVLLFLSLIPTGLLMTLFGLLLHTFILGRNMPQENLAQTLDAHRNATFIILIIFRSLTWTIIGLAMGLGMNLTRSSSAQRRASMVGGAIGGAIGGLLFDSVGRFIVQNEMDATLPRLVGLASVGSSIGLCVALTERFIREAWVRVRVGYLKGQLFILYHNPTIIGSAPQSDVYLFKDGGIDPSHAAIHHVGGSYEIEALKSNCKVLVNGKQVERRKVSSGDYITVGGTVLSFEERGKRRLVEEVKLRYDRNSKTTKN